MDDLAEVRTGLTLRGSNATLFSSDAGPHYLRIGDLTANGIVHINMPDRIALPPEVTEKYLLRKGDLVLANRGSRLTAAVFEEDIETVACSQFYIIQIKGAAKVLPQFLSWFLNLEATTASLHSLATGATIKSVPVGAVRSLLVPVPSLERQRQIVEFMKLWNLEKEILEDLERLKAQLFQHSLLHAASQDARFRP
ncbi:MAG: restriction endonuclease subunit S [Chthoniobacteraceae bacterium]